MLLKVYPGHLVGLCLPTQVFTKPRLCLNEWNTCLFDVGYWKQVFKTKLLEGLMKVTGGSLSPAPGDMHLCMVWSWKYVRELCSGREDASRVRTDMETGDRAKGRRLANGGAAGPTPRDPANSPSSAVWETQLYYGSRDVEAWRTRGSQASVTCSFNLEGLTATPQGQLVPHACED